MNVRSLQCVFVRFPPYLDLVLSHPRERQVPLGIAQMAGCLKAAGHAVRVIDLWIDRLTVPEVARRIRDMDPGLIVVPVDSENRASVLAFGRRLREEGFATGRLVALGQYAETFPERLVGPAGPFDACILGEPERTVVELASGADLSAVNGVAYPAHGGNALVRTPPRELIEDIDELPQPAFELFDLDRYRKQAAFVPVAGKVRWGWILSSRGCPFRCIFCSPTLRKSWGEHFRGHSPRYVVDLMERLVRVHGCNAIAFEDDVFTGSRNRTLAICDEVIARGLKVAWTAETHLATIDEEVARRMYAAGCRGVCAGIEAGNDEVRARIKRNSLKRETLEQNVAMLRSIGIDLTLYFMIANPGETIAQMEETLALARRLKPMLIQLAFFTPYPGSQAWEEFHPDADMDDKMSHYDTFPVNLSAASREEVLAFYGRFYRGFYLDPAYVARYVARRMPYALLQGGKGEIGLILHALALFAAPVLGLLARSRDRGEP